ncbi:MAG TPA: flagellar motor protein MotB, partial [Geobacteraceae bacterium]|nr:flagellar motor protein MotB [Geobacteraceae bacterium]
MSRRHKKPEKEGNHERWLVSYADFITLLFAVFVALYAMSQTDKRKTDQLVASLRESFGYVKTGASSEKLNLTESTDLRTIPAIRPEVLTPGLRRAEVSTARTHASLKEFREIKVAIAQNLKKYGAEKKLSVDVNKRGLVVSLKETGFFDSGDATVKQQSLPLLAMVAKSLASYSNPSRIEGNTDNVPINSGSYRSNWELSTARATNIVHYLIENYNFRPGKISAVGYGEFRPLADNGTEAGRTRNRRVDIVLLAK